MTSSTKKSVGKTILKVAGIISTVLIGLIIIVSVLLLTVLEPYAEHFLKKKVSETTDELYSLDFDDLDINLLSLTVELDNPQLQYDSAVHEKLKEKGEAGPYLLNAKIEELEISGVNILDYLFRSRINILSILIDQPVIQLVHDTGITQKKDSSSKKQSSIDIISSLRLGNFDLKDAEISYRNFKNKEEVIHKVPQLNIQISDFTADSLNSKDILKMIDMDDLFVSLQNQSFTTANKAYNLHFDLFSYSIADQQLKLESFSAIGDHTKMKKPMIAPEIQVPLLKMEGMEIIKALKTKKLHLDELLIDSTYVELYEIPDLDITVADVYRGLAQLFEVTEIDDLRIDRSSVSMYSRDNKDVLVQKIENVDLLMEEVSFDSLSVFDPRNNLALQQLTLKIDNYLLTPEGSPYTFSLEKMNMNTNHDHLELVNLMLEPDIKKNKELGYHSEKASAQLIDINIPKIEFEGMNLINAFEHSNLDINQIAIPSSTTLITKAFEAQSSGGGFSPKAVYEGFSFFVKEINIGEFQISDAEVSKYPSTQQINKIHHLEQARLILKGFHFDSIMAYQQKKVAPINEILVQMEHYRFGTPNSDQNFEMGPLTYSSGKGEFEMNNIRFDSQSGTTAKKTDSLSFYSSQLSISDLNIITAFNKGSLQIEEIQLNSPEIVMSGGTKTSGSTKEKDENSQKVPGAKFFEWINPVVVKSIIIDNGTAAYTKRLLDANNYQNLAGFSVEVKGLKISPETIKNIKNKVPIESMQMQAKNYSFFSPDSIYTVTLDSLFYTSGQGELTAEKFALVPDYQLHQLRVKNDIEASHSNLFEISADEFSIKAFDLVNDFNTDQYRFGEILLAAPEVTIIQDKEVANYQDSLAQNGNNEQQKANISEKPKGDNSKEEAIAKSMRTDINEFVDLFRIDSLRIEDAQFGFEIIRNDSMRTGLELDHLSLLVQNIKLENLQAYEFIDLFSVGDIDLLLRNYSMITPDSLHEIRVNQVKASLSDQYVRIDSIHYKPLFLIDEYADRLNYAKDRFDVKVGEVNIEGIDFDQLFNKQHYVMDKFLMDGLNGSIYRDNRVKQDPSRKPRTVQQFVKDLPVPIQLDTLALEDAVIIYSEVSKEGSIPGVVTLSDTQFEIINITNDSLLYTKKDTMKVRGSTSFLSESKLEISFNFLMTHPEDLYTYKGYLEEMKFKAFNPLFTNLLNVKMESGVIEKIDFSVTATKHQSEGMMYFPYENLKFSLLNKDDVGNPGFWLNVANWSLNNLLIKSNNPGRLFNSYREGTINVDRNYSKSVFNHMGNSLLSGLVSSTIPEPTETILNWVIDLP